MRKAKDSTLEMQALKDRIKSLEEQNKKLENDIEKRDLEIQNLLLENIRHLRVIAQLKGEEDPVLRTKRIAITVAEAICESIKEKYEEPE